MYLCTAHTFVMYYIYILNSQIIITQYAMDISIHG